MIKLIVLMFGTIVLSCATPTNYIASPLSEQILRVRTDYPGKLTNNVSGGVITQYDLKDTTLRQKLINFGFKCKVAGTRYRICKDKPGYCRWTEKCIKHSFLWWGCSLYEEKYIEANKEHKYLVDAKVVCQKN